MDPRRTSLDDVAPGRLVARSGGGYQSNELLGVGVVHTSHEVYRSDRVPPEITLRSGARRNHPNPLPRGHSHQPEGWNS